MSISWELLEAEDKQAVLIKEIVKLNDYLPCNAYIPFSKDHIRNYCVLHIPPNEVHVFKTHSRAPFLIAVELFLPEEAVTKENNLDDSIAYNLSHEITINSAKKKESEKISNSTRLLLRKVQKKMPKFNLTIVPSLTLKNSPSKGFCIPSFSSINKEPLYPIEEDKIVDSIKPSNRSETIKAINNLNVFGESYKLQTERIRKQSPYGSLSTWRLTKFIVKTNDNLIQEQFAMQLISQFKSIFKSSNLNLWVYSYEILCTGPNCGLIECINDITTLDGLFKKINSIGVNTLSEFYEHYFIGQELQKARECLAYSLAAYSLITYLLNIKDRHNANIMIDTYGHILHIDFGFFISNNPGNINIESAPFKLPSDWVNALGGMESVYFRMFRSGMIEGLLAIQKEYHQIQTLIEAMYNLHEDLPCFSGKLFAIQEVENRIFPNVNGSNIKRRLNPTEAAIFIDRLIEKANNNWRARAYDYYQYCCQGIY